MKIPKVRMVILFIFILGYLPNSAFAWWACPSGYTFKLNSSKTKVKCTRSARVYTQRLRSCPRTKIFGVWFGSGLSIDYYGKADACVTQDPTGSVRSVVPHSFCSGSYRQVKRSGRDKCVKRIGRREVAPTRNVR